MAKTKHLYRVNVYMHVHRKTEGMVELVLGAFLASCTIHLDLLITSLARRHDSGRKCIQNQALI